MNQIGTDDDKISQEDGSTSANKNTSWKRGVMFPDFQVCAEGFFFFFF